MKRNSLSTVLATVLAMAATACSNVGNDENAEAPYVICPVEGLQLTEAQLRMSEKQNSFAWRMFSEINSEAKGKSTVCSPLSMAYCLGMANAGAAGSTSDEITAALGFNSGAADINQYCKTLMSELPGLDSSTEFNIANCVEVNTPHTLLSDYKNTVKDCYNALVESRDFADAGFTGYLNGWVSRQTKGMVPKLFDSTNPDAVAYIVNALYFKGIWASKFDKTLTAKEHFYKADGSETEVSMMRQTNSYSYDSNEVCQAVGLDYGYGAYSMQILLPNEGKTVSDVAAYMQGVSWKDFVDRMPINDVALSLPRFTVEYGGEMNNVLKRLGISAMFSADADFSKLCDTEVFVSKVIQKAKIEVDEEGSKAAAATGMELLATAIQDPQPIVFRADRPFIYVITERSTGTICFIGMYGGE